MMIKTSSTDKNLRVIVDCHLKLDKYINATCKYVFHMTNIYSSYIELLV